MSPELRAGLRAAPRILFVCSGNMIRSAFAELYARYLGLPWPVSSAATTWYNEHIHRCTRAELLARGVPMELVDSFRPTHLSALRDRLEPGTLAFAMTREHLQVLEDLSERIPRRFLLGEVEGGGEEIPDPLEDGDYERCFATIARCVETLVRAAVN